MNNQKIIISGPTAVGKTYIAVELCKQINGSIISADSRQVYKYLDIGTNKDGKLGKDNVRKIDNISQYLTDIIEPNQKYSAKNFEQDAEKYEKIILQENKIPVIVGGTGLYIKSFLYGLDDLPDADETIRFSIQKDIDNNGLDYVYDELSRVDICSAQKNKGNTQRIIRALEVYKLTGKTMTELLNKKIVKNKNFKHFVILKDREQLYSDINTRCAKMITSGMIEEVEKVLNMGYDKNCYALTGVGYKHIVKYLDNKITKQELIEQFSKDTRQYAKRQITWFKNQMDIELIDIIGGNYKSAVEMILRY
ncbi:MAG: tRNA (adenosine(37)-N6)-dimethylallyltransferase MiaA [Endomicrobiia bacterium]|nr:tRNA (adenosine(37)-N6)-dimethylallyltransferase MiaA [Endomicrobiaceae bacterium]MDD3922278.1 tRNA (adenosine(37)-N6)-dimethylallyltransferase MiaA [Endomicrobiaceae bacterium]